VTGPGETRRGVLVPDRFNQGAVRITAGTVDPSVIPVKEKIGSLYLNRQTGQVFRKTGTGNTDWEEMDDGGGIEEFSFVAGDWAAGIANEIQIVRAPAVPGPGQIGPHGLGLGVAYVTQVFEDAGGNDLNIVDVEVEMNTVTGLVTMRKAPVPPGFAGRVVIEDSL